MESLTALLILVLVALVVLPIVAIVLSTNRTNAMRAEIAGLISRIWDLENKVARLTSPPAARVDVRPEPAPSPSSIEVAPEAAPAEKRVEVAAVESHQLAHKLPPSHDEELPPVAPPKFSMVDDGRPEVSPSLESRIGSTWFNRIGILAVLIGVAWFLKLAFDNHWIGPLGRVMIGLLAGAALIGWSERFNKRGFAIFSYSLKAIGSGTLYLSLWAAFQLYGLMPAGAAFAAMIAVTAFNGCMAWVQNSELLALYAIAGGLSTPLLVSTGGNHEVTLFCYLLILDLAVLVLVVLRPWSRLLFASYVATASLIFAWWTTFYTQPQAGRTALFLACFFVPFSLAPRLAKLTFQTAENFEGWDILAAGVLPVMNAALGFAGFYALLTPAAEHWAAPWLAVAFAAFYLFLSRLPARALLGKGIAALPALHFTLAVVFLTLAIPLKTQGRWLTIGWLVEGTALLWLDRRFRSKILEVFGLICVFLGLCALLFVNPPAVTRPVVNERFATYCVAIAVFAFIAWMAKSDAGKDQPDRPSNLPNMAPIAVLIVNALILIAFSLEIHSYWWLQLWHGDYSLMNDYTRDAQFSYSALFMLFGGALLTVGFVKRSAFLRWQALILIAATIAKVFVVDVSELSQGLRIFSFIGLGVLLLGVSFVYQRDWLNLRRQEEKS